jgi:hypothetical protein
MSSNSSDRASAPAKLPRICRKLRTKHAFDSDPEGAMWKLGDATTESYWCLATMEPFGPDGSYCHPHVCGEGRSCYQPADEDGPPSV